MVKKVIMSIVVVVIAIHGNAQAAEMGEQELKKVSVKIRLNEPIPLTILPPGRVQFAIADRQVGPFDLPGIKPIEEAEILAMRKTDANKFVYGLIYGEKRNNDRIFSIRFDNDWKKPKVLFQSSLQLVYPDLSMFREQFLGIDGIKNKSGIIALADPGRIVVAGIYPNGQGILLFQFDYFGKQVYDTTADKISTAVESGGIAKINNISIKGDREEPSFLVSILYTLANGKQGVENFTIRNPHVVGSEKNRKSKEAGARPKYKPVVGGECIWGRYK